MKSYLHYQLSSQKLSSEVPSSTGLSLHWMSHWVVNASSIQAKGIVDVGVRFINSALYIGDGALFSVF